MPNPPPPKPKVLLVASDETSGVKKSFATLGKDDARSARTRNETKLNTTQGEVVVDDLDVPEDVKELLFDLDFDSTGNISHQDLKDICAVLSQIHDELGEGSSNAHVIYLMELVVQQVCRKKTNASFMEYAHLPEKLQKCFRVWDIDGDGHVDAAELMAAADAWQRLKKESALMKKLLLAACFVMALMFVGMFVMGMVTAELAKEFKAGGAGANPKMTSKAGDTIQVASSDTQIDANGMLMTRAAVVNNTQNGRHLPGSGTGSVATQTTKTKTKIVSTLPDSFWNALAELTIHSNKGHTLSLKIQGFARIPLRNSRCGNVLKLYTSVDGAIVFDSDDMSFEDKLDTLFKNAGFEVAVGGAAGRRLASSAGVDGFFDHVSKMESEGSWKCGDIPLPRMPATTIQKFDTYIACKYANPSSDKLQKTACDSAYGGYVLGTVDIPAEHYSATLSRVDKVLAELGNSKTGHQGRLYSKSSEAIYKSPSYKVQRSSNKGNLAQEFVRVTGLTEKKSVSFQQMVAGEDEPAIRNFCKDDSKGNPVLKENTAVKDDSTDTSIHFEYVGLEGEGDHVYRRWRMMPAKDFNAMMDSEAMGKQPDNAFHYWDRADDDLFTPYRVVTPGGDILVYSEVSQTATDAEVEAFLKTTLSATKFGNFVKPYKFECDDIETGDDNEEFVHVPQIESGDLAESSVKFWARWVFDKFSTSDPENDSNSGDVTSMIRAQYEGKDISAFLKPAFAFLATIESTSPYYAFAKYALKSQEKLSMADVCSKPCAAERKSVQDYIGQNGDDQMCSAPRLKNLAICIQDLDFAIAVYCGQSRFWKSYERDCVQNKGNSRRLQVSHATVDHLSDGTKSFDLGSLDHAARMHLSSALSASLNGKSFGDLKGYRFLFNASDMDRPSHNVLLSNWDEPEPVESRRLEDATSPYTSCGFDAEYDKKKGSGKIAGFEYDKKTGISAPGFCFTMHVPKAASIWDCLMACPYRPGKAPMDAKTCGKAIAKSCLIKLTFKLTTPWHIAVNNFGTGDDRSDKGWVFGLELAGTYPIPKMFGVTDPVKGDWTLTGGIFYTTENICPQIPATIQGYAGMAIAIGLKMPPRTIPDIDALAITLKLDANIVKVEEGVTRTRTDRRRGFEWPWQYTRRRRAKYKTVFVPYSCQYVFTAHLQIMFLNVLEFWFKLVYKMVEKELTFSLGAIFYVPIIGTSIPIFAETLVQEVMGPK